MNRRGAELAKVTAVTLFRAQFHDEVFNPRRGGLSLASAAPCAGPIDSIQALSARMGDPALHGMQTDTKLRSNSSQRSALSNGCHHPTTTLNNGLS